MRKWFQVLLILVCSLTLFGCQSEVGQIQSYFTSTAPMEAKLESVLNRTMRLGNTPESLRDAQLQELQNETADLLEKASRLSVPKPLEQYHALFSNNFQQLNSFLELTEKKKLSGDAYFEQFSRVQATVLENLRQGITEQDRIAKKYDLDFGGFKGELTEEEMNQKKAEFTEAEEKEEQQEAEGEKKAKAEKTGHEDFYKDDLIGSCTCCP